MADTNHGESMATTNHCFFFLYMRNPVNKTICFCVDIKDRILIGAGCYIDKFIGNLGPSEGMEEIYCSHK